MSDEYHDGVLWVTAQERKTLFALRDLAQRLAEYAEPTADAADVVDDDEVVEDVWDAVHELLTEYVAEELEHRRDAEVAQ